MDWDNCNSEDDEPVLEFFNHGHTCQLITCVNDKIPGESFCQSHLYLKHHKPPDKCKTCQKGVPKFGYPHYFPEYCSQDKKLGMVDLITLHCQKCKGIATFAINGQTKPTLCFRHKTEDMVKPKQKYCLVEDCPLVAIQGWKKNQKIFCIKHLHKL